MTAVETPTKEKVVIICADCKNERACAVTAAGQPRTPAGWKHHEAHHYCSGCWSKRYILRAVTLPVASPLDVSWEDLRAALKIMWRQTTGAANRIMTECYARDVRRDGADKMPPMPRIYLYPELRTEFPLLPSQTVAALEQSCQRKYRAARYNVIWTASASLPTYRYPTPFPIPAQGWSVRIEDQRTVVSLRIQDKRLDLRLKSGSQFRRQTSQVIQIVGGSAVQGEAAILQKGTALMLKMVAWLPRKTATGLSGTLRVRTATDSLLLAINEKDECLWKYHGDHVRKWAAEHRKRLQKWADDSKFEARPVPAFTDLRTAASHKFRDRMDSAAHEISAQLAGYATRRKFSAVEYDDTEHGFCAEFTWYKMRELVSQKLDAAGIEFIASGKESGQPPADSEAAVE